MCEDEDERQRCDHGSGVRETDHRVAHQFPPAQRTPAGTHGRNCRGAHMALPRAGRHTSQRAIAFTITVTMNRPAPTAISDDRSRSLVASLNSFAISDAIVYPGANSEAEMSCALPITIVTAIVSPSARPSPRMIPPMIPERAYGSTASQII